MRFISVLVCFRALLTWGAMVRAGRSHEAKLRKSSRLSAFPAAEIRWSRSGCVPVVRRFRPGSLFRNFPAKATDNKRRKSKIIICAAVFFFFRWQFSLKLPALRIVPDRKGLRYSRCTVRSGDVPGRNRSVRTGSRAGYIPAGAPGRRMRTSLTAKPFAPLSFPFAIRPQR